MASSMALNKLVCAVTMCMVLGAAPLAHAAISRGQVFTVRSSCIGYAKGGGALNSSCCNGVRALNSAAKTTPYRHPTCGCLKSLVRSVHGVVAGITASVERGLCLKNQ